MILKRDRFRNEWCISSNEKGIALCLSKSNPPFHWSYYPCVYTSSQMSKAHREFHPIDHSRAHGEVHQVNSPAMNSNKFRKRRSPIPLVMVKALEVFRVKKNDTVMGHFNGSLWLDDAMHIAPKLYTTIEYQAMNSSSPSKVSSKVRQRFRNENYYAACLIFQD